MKRILSNSARAWYGNDLPGNFDPSRWEGDAGLDTKRTGPKTEDEVKDEWGKKVKEKSVKCKCKRKCNCGEDCPCRKS